MNKYDRFCSEAFLWGGISFAVELCEVATQSLHVFVNEGSRFEYLVL